MAIRKLDEITLPLEYDNKIADIDKWLDNYYKTMPATEEQKERRKDLAKEMRDVLILVLLLMREMAERDAFDYDYILTVFTVEFTNALGGKIRVDDYITEYIDRFTKEYVDTTIEHVVEKKEASYMMSDDRATIAGANVANALVGYEELQEAKDKGYTKKMWVSQRDNRVRDTHILADGQKRDIDDYFMVGGTAMMIPCDPDCEVVEEVAGCRCVCKFIR